MRLNLSSLTWRKSPTCTVDAARGRRSAKDASLGKSGIVNSFRLVSEVPLLEVAGEFSPWPTLRLCLARKASCSSIARFRSSSSSEPCRCMRLADNGTGDEGERALTLSRPWLRPRVSTVKGCRFLSGLPPLLPRLDVRLEPLVLVLVDLLDVVDSPASKNFGVVKLAKSSGDMGIGDVGDRFGFTQLRAEARPRSSDGSRDLSRLSRLSWRVLELSRGRSLL